MVHILQSISSAPIVTVSPKTRDLGSFLFRGKQLGSSSFYWRSCRREQTCECCLSVSVLRCWSSVCWLKAALALEEFCATLTSSCWEGAGSSRSCRGEMSCVSSGRQEKAAHFPWHKPATFWAAGLEYLTQRSPGYTGLTPPIPCQRYWCQKCLLCVTSVVLPVLWVVMEIVFSQHRPLSHASVSRRALISLGKVILAQKSGYSVLRERQLRLERGQSPFPVGRRGCLEGFCCPSTG